MENKLLTVFFSDGVIGEFFFLEHFYFYDYKLFFKL